MVFHFNSAVRLRETRENRLLQNKQCCQEVDKVGRRKDGTKTIVIMF